MAAQINRPIKRVNKEQAIKLRTENNLTYEAIAKIQGVDKAAIFRAIKHLVPTEQTRSFISNRADILAHQQYRLLSFVTDGKLRKASAYQLIGSAGLLYDKERLERGQATEITDYRAINLHGSLTDLKRRLEVLSGGNGGDPVDAKAETTPTDV